MSESVAVIGLGAMGLGVAQSLRRAGFHVRGCDVVTEVARKFAADGGTACATPAEAAENRMTHGLATIAGEGA